jgi:hypothetical protein
MNPQDIKIQNLEKQINDLNNQVRFLTELYHKNNFSGEYVFNQKVTFKNGFAFADGSNIPLGSTTGTKLGTSSTQKLGFWGVTPVVQQSAISAPSGGATIDSQARSSINSIISLLHTLGLTL